MRHEVRKICYDRLLPRDLRRPQASISQGPGRPPRAIAERNKQWPNGSELTVAFLGGTAGDQAEVKRVAPEWSKHANLKFKFSASRNGQIRISFDEIDGAWSYLGLDNLEVPPGAATMNLGWIDSNVILHEFGHAIGLAHEHQNPQGGIQWNEDAVIDELSGPPNWWDEETIRVNVLEKYSMDQVIGTVFDAKSIMLYEFPAEWTLNGVETHMNEVLSAQDKSFVKSSQMYPPLTTPPPANPILPVHRGFDGAISKAGERDIYQFTIQKQGVYVIEVMSDIDLFLSLYGPGSVTKLIATDDDAGYKTNPRIEALLTPGEYYVTVRHYSKTGVGPYRIWVAG